jgi:hypothetical protein
LWGIDDSSITLDLASLARCLRDWLTCDGLWILGDQLLTTHLILSLTRLLGSDINLCDARGRQNLLLHKKLLLLWLNWFLLDILKRLKILWGQRDGLLLDWSGLNHLDR